MEVNRIIVNSQETWLRVQTRKKKMLANSIVLSIFGALFLFSNVYIFLKSFFFFLNGDYNLILTI